MPSIAAFLSFACIMSFTPGPNNIMALSSASAYGLRKGLRFCFGVLLGVLGLMTACALFGAALFRFLPDVEPTMRAVGAAYILWMAFGVWRSGSGNEDSRLVPVNGVVSGMLLQFVNPKGILYGITAFSSSMIPLWLWLFPSACSRLSPMPGHVFGRFLEPYSAVSSRTTIPPPTRAWRSCWCGVPLPCIPNYLKWM